MMRTAYTLESLPPAAWSMVEPGELVSSHLDVIERAARRVTSRSRLSREEREDFVSSVVIRLLENEGHSLRRFSERSSFATYIYRVVQNLWIDHVRATVGRFRPSTHASRLGEPALTLERLVYRDGYSLSEAIQTVRSTDSIESDDEELSALFHKLPVRGRRFASTGSERYVCSTGSADDFEPADRYRLNLLRVELNRALAAALASLGHDEKRVLRLRYGRGCSVKRIADIIGIEPARIYRLFDRVKAKLRSACAAAGLYTSDVRHNIAEISIELPALDDFLADAKKVRHSVTPGGEWR